MGEAWLATRGAWSSSVAQMGGTEAARTLVGAVLLWFPWQKEAGMSADGFSREEAWEGGRKR